MAVQSCLSQSTAHGLMNIGNSQKWSGKILWLILTLMTLSAFAFHTFLLYFQLLDEKVLVSTFPDWIPFQQPDIVFCSERFFARDYINTPPEDEYKFMLNVSKSIKVVDKMFNVLKNKSSRFIWDSLKYHELYRAFFHRKHQLFLSIKCNMKDVNIDNLEEEMNFLHFACYRLRPPSCRLNSPLDTIIVKFYTYIYGLNITYSRLNVTIDNKTIDNYLFIQKEIPDDMEDGIHVYFVQHNEGITEGHTKITASVNTHTTMKIKSTKFDRLSTSSSPCMKEIKYRQFYNLLEEDIRRNPMNLTYQSVCKEVIFQELMYKAVQCVMSRFPIPYNLPGNFTFCGDMRTIYSKMDFMDIWGQDESKTEMIETCKGNVSCTFIRYWATVTYNHWPRTATMRNLFRIIIPNKLDYLKARNLSSPGLKEAMKDFKRNASNINNWKRNFVKVSISPGEFMSTVIEESAAYSWKNFFSDVGGIMGFYMGASVLTLCELFRLMHCTMNTIVKTKKDQEEVDDMPLKEATA